MARERDAHYATTYGRDCQVITAQVESFEAALPELRLIFPAHHWELGLFQDRMPLDPQYDEYVRRECAGSLFLVTVRKDGKIAGYYTCQVQPGFHYGSTLTGTMDMLFIVPEFRHQGFIVPLLRCVERELKRRGAQVWYSGNKTDKPLLLPAIYDLFGFLNADTYRVRWLGS